MDLNQLFDVFFWFNLEPESLGIWTTVLFLSFFALLLVSKVLGKALYLNYKKTLLAPEKRLLSKCESFFLTMGFSGLAWTFFAYEALPILSARFWIFVWIVSCILWIYFLAHYALVEMPVLLGQIKEKEKREKYLPKRK